MKIVFFLTSSLALLLIGCESRTNGNAQEDVPVETLASGLVGSNPDAAALGKELGSASGGLLGYNLNQSDRDTLAKNAPSTLNKIDNKEQLNLDDIEQMSSNGLSETAIINQIKATHSTYDLSQREIIKLERSNVPEKVIDFMVSNEK